MLGDRESGKTTLLAKLQGNEDPKKGSGLEFGYIEVLEKNSGLVDGAVVKPSVANFFPDRRSVCIVAC